MNAIKPTAEKRGLFALLVYCVVAAGLLFQTSAAHAFGATECAASRFGSKPNCTANDVSITGIAVTGGTATCTGGGTVTLDLDLTVNFASPTRYDIGIFISNDGKSPQLLAASGGASSCTVSALPTSLPFLNDGPPYNSCGDGDNAINGGTGQGHVYLTGVTVPCQTNAASGGNLYIPYLVSWSQSAGNICTGANDVVPDNSAKCSISSPATNSVSVVVMPAITNTDGTTTIAPGDSNTYFVTITNSSGVSISGAVFKDPAVANLSSYSVSCAAAGTATCPALTAAAMLSGMQGAGITLPAMPNGGSLTFTINATLSAAATGSLSNVASLTLNSKTVSVTDTDTIVVSSYAYYPMDEASWAAGATVLDASGNGRHGTKLGTATPTSYPAASPPGSAIAGTPGTCGSASIPLNTLNTDQTGVSLPITPQTLGGGTSGSIMFWYNSNTAWNTAGTDRMLLDASTGALTTSPAFWVMKKANGSVIWSFTDAFGWTHNVTSSAHAFSANSWHHIAISWKFVQNFFTNPVTMDLYIDGVKENTTYGGSGMYLGVESCTNGFCFMGPSTATIYLGDNRTSGVTPATCASSGFSGFCGAAISGTGNSANGAIDEVYLFDTSANLAKVTTVKGSSHACVAPVDHFVVSHAGTGVNCQKETVTISAHAADHSVVTSATGTITVATSSAHGDWSLNTGSGTFTAGASNSGSATYTFAAADNGVVKLDLKDTYPETLSINIVDSGGTITENSGTAGTDAAPGSDPSLTFVNSALRFIDATGSATIGTQIAGKDTNVAPGAQTLYLQAIRTDTSTNACAAVFASGTTVNVLMGSECSNPASCIAGKNVSVTNNAITTSLASNGSGAITASTGSYTSVPLKFGASSQAPIVLNYPDAGKIRLWASYTIPLGSGAGSGNKMTGSSSQFVVRPFGFYLSGIKCSTYDATNCSPLLASPGNNPAGASAAGAAFLPAGRDFTAAVTAVAWQAADDANNDGIPDAGVNLTDNVATPNFGKETAAEGVTLAHALVAGLGLTAPGTLGNPAAFGAFSAGLATGTTFNWSEVGIISLTPTLTSGNYLGSGSTVTGLSSGNVGRFYPDHFIVTGTLSNRDYLACVSTSSFTYMGEPMLLTLTPTAQNASNGTTQNYVSSATAANNFSKLDGATVGNWTAAIGTANSIGLGAVNGTTTALTGRLSVLSTTPPGPPTSAWIAGVGTLTANVVLSRVAGGPFDSLNLGIAPKDADGVSLLPAALDLDADVDVSTTLERKLVASTKVRYGRMMIPNSYGSQQSQLPINIVAQYWNGTSYLTNTLDNCTSLATASFGTPVAATGGTFTTTITGGGTVAGGIGTITLTKPTGFTSKGSVDISSTIPYLPGFGRETFGVYKAGPVIYTRELY